MHHIVSAPRAAGSLPLLCFLHGYGEAAPMAIDRALRRHGPLAAGAAPFAVREFIVLAPQLPTAGDLWAAMRTRCSRSSTTCAPGRRWM